MKDTVRNLVPSQNVGKSITKITGSLKPFGIKQLNQLHRGVSDVEAYQQCHHSNILGWESNPMNSNPANLVQSALHGLFGMWRSMTVVGSPDGSGCRTLSAFAWRCVTELKSRSWSALLALILAHNTSWSVFEPGPQPADWCHPSSLNKNCHSIPTPDLMRRKKSQLAETVIPPRSWPFLASGVFFFKRAACTTYDDLDLLSTQLSRQVDLASAATSFFKVALLRRAPSQWIDICNTKHYHTSSIKRSKAKSTPRSQWCGHGFYLHDLLQPWQWIWISDVLTLICWSLPVPSTELQQQQGLVGCAGTCARELRESLAAISCWLIWGHKLLARVTGIDIWFQGGRLALIQVKANCRMVPPLIEIPSLLRPREITHQTATDLPYRALFKVDGITAKGRDFRRFFNPSFNPWCLCNMKGKWHYCYSGTAKQLHGSRLCKDQNMIWIDLYVEHECNSLNVIYVYRLCHCMSSIPSTHSYIHAYVLKPRCQMCNHLISDLHNAP